MRSYRRIRYVCALVAAVLVSCLLTGCSVLNQIVGADDWESWVPDSTSVLISGSGTVTEVLMDTLDESWYDENELQDLIARSVREYNEAHETDSITVTAYSVENGDVSLTMEYKTPEDYSEYNNIAFFSGSMLEAEMEGYLFEGPFYEVSAASVSDTESDREEVMSHKEYQVVIAGEGRVIQVPGAIKYVSAGTQCVNSHVAKAEETASDETEAGLVLPSNAVYYTDPSEDERDISDEEKDRSYIYIIYEYDASQRDAET